MVLFGIARLVAFYLRGRIGACCLAPASAATGIDEAVEGSVPATSNANKYKLPLAAWLMT